MILAAGLGTRLKPLTDNRPKALVVYQGKPLLQHALEHLAKFGFRDIIINIHHFPGQITDFLRNRHNFGMNIVFSEELLQPLETGGGLRQAAWFFDDGNPFLVRNVDILSDLDLNRMQEAHSEHHPLATLAVRQRNSSRYFLFDQDGILSGWQNRITGKERISRPASVMNPLAFSGIQILDPAIFSLITEEGAFSLTDLYLRLAENHIIRAFMDHEDTWMDLGKIEIGNLS